MSRTIDTIMGPFNFQQAQKLRRRHQTAVRKGEESFKFQGQDWQTDFAAYMVEFLENNFGLKSEDG